MTDLAYADRGSLGSIVSFASKTHLGIAVLRNVVVMTSATVMVRAIRLGHACVTQGILAQIVTFVIPMLEA